jgi:hypothetical protein
MKSLLTVVVATALFFGAAMTADAARPGRWKLLGKKNVTDRVDRDVIMVTGKRGEWSAMKIVVNKRAVEFRSVKVHYANGSVQDVELRKVIPSGGSSRVIDLKGATRVIKKIELVYDAQSLGGKAVVKVYGRR